MYKGKRILAIIPARGGSKGLPGKNIKDLCGKPLIAWSIEQAKESLYIDEIFISTDSSEIANIAEKFGVKVPELRPSKLAEDNSPSYEFVLHTIDFYKNKGIIFDYFILLEPTSPLRKNDDIDNVIKLAIENPQKDGVVTLGEVHMEHPSIVKSVTEKGGISNYCDNNLYTQRQQLSKAYFPYGVAYMTKVNNFINKHSFYGENSLPYFIERWQNYEIDDIYDFITIEAIFKYKQNE